MPHPTLHISLKESWLRQERPLQGHLRFQATAPTMISEITLTLEKAFPGREPQLIGEFHEACELILDTNTPYDWPFLLDHTEPQEGIFDLFGMSDKLKNRTQTIGKTLGHIVSEFYLQIEVVGERGETSFVERVRLFVRIV